MSDFKFSYYIVATDVIDESKDVQQRVLFATRTAKSIAIDNNVYKDLLINKFDNISTSLMAELISMEAVVPNEEDELDFILLNNQAAIDDNSILGIVIQPGASCQLGCGYCGQQHSKHYMSPDLQRKMLNRIRQKVERGSYKHLSITWYGGEPLMALKQIRAMSPELIAIAKDNGIGYSADMVTNALSLKENIFVELFDDLQIKSFQVTIDGTQEYHDARRHTKENNPTFDIIFNNILTIVSREDYKRFGSAITIRCNMDKTNIESLYPFIDLLAQHKLQNKVGFYVAPIHNWGDNNAQGIYGLDKDNFASLEIDWMMELIKQGFKISILPTRTKIVCMVVNEDSEVYDAFGNISTCWEIPYTPIFENSEYIIGNLSLPDAVATSNIPMRNWNMEIPTTDSWCKTCNLLPVCGGSCPKHWLSGTPACPSFKFNIEDRVLLHYIAHQKDMKELAF